MGVGRVKGFLNHASLRKLQESALVGVGVVAGCTILEPRTEAWAGHFSKEVLCLTIH